MESTRNTARDFTGNPTGGRVSDVKIPFPLPGEDVTRETPCNAPSAASPSSR